jgi:hypothetical protein
MKRALFSLVVFFGVASCQPTEHTPPSPPPSDFDTSVDNFTVLICQVGDVCVDQDPVACETDVRTDLADAEEILDEAGEAQCIECLDAKAIELQKLLDADCDVTVLDNAAVFAACDLDPAVDFDGNGTADDDDDEACAGFP